MFKIAILAVFLFALYYGGKKAYAFGYTVFTTGTVEKAPGTNKEVTVLQGMSDRNVGKLLEQQGLVKSGSIFFVQAKIYGYDILPGNYTLNTSQTIEEMLTVLSAKPEG